MSHKVAIRYKGELVDGGRPNEVFVNPYYSYTRLLLGSIATVDRRWEVEVGTAIQGV